MANEVLKRMILDTYTNTLQNDVQSAIDLFEAVETLLERGM